MEEDQESKKEHEHKIENKRKIDSWKISTAVLAVLLIISVATGGFKFSLGSNNVIDNTLTFINEQMLRSGTEATLDGYEEIDGVYKLNLVVSLNNLSQKVESYVTKDGKMFFPSGVNLEELKPVKPVLSDKPKVDLFVMSQCPYGVLAEQSFGPVLKLFKERIDFNLYFIASETNNVFTSLHGQAEVDEDIRQVCAIKYYPDKYLDYVLCVDKDYKNVGTVWEKCATDNGLDKEKIKSCWQGTEGKELFKKNIEVGNKLKVSGSPTIYVNDVPYQGGRSSDEFKEGICNSFKSKPKECGETLNVGNVGSVPVGSC